ncbi:hypothetical protein Tco_0839536 [Tanacetum coccineum]|uniref:Uncharacterized protein n=1 Tax=Tanacetum coccineum TaxID=301880 RepID=A0ABQ5ASR1_9ASTR
MGMICHNCEAQTSWMKYSIISSFGPSETITKRTSNELRAERMAKNANPLAFYGSMTSSVGQRYAEAFGIKAKYFKPLTQPRTTTSEFLNTRNKTVDTNPSYKTEIRTGQYGIRGVTAVGAREIHSPPPPLVWGGEGVLTSRSNLRLASRTGSMEIDETRVGAHYSYMAKIKRFLSRTQAMTLNSIGTVETGDSNVIPDSPDMCDNDIQNDQHDVECDDERAALANLKLDVDDNKKITKH